MADVTVDVHTCIIRKVDMHEINHLCQKILHVVKFLKLVCALVYRAIPIHDAITREKRVLGSQLGCVLILDRVPKHSNLIRSIEQLV